MAKIFRLHKGSSSDSISGWGTSGMIGENQIESMGDTSNDSFNVEITSIPSPFARIDLVKTAFAFVSKTNIKGEYPNLDIKNIYSKMVSHSLDVGQIFFEYERWKDLVDIIEWDKNNGISALKKGKPGHRQVADTMELFLQSDAKEYNFNLLSKIYLLNYKRGPRQLNIIGATSPATMFFCSANDLSYVKDIFFGGNDKPFDNDFAHLYERDIEFHKFMHGFKNIVGFEEKFKELNRYLDACYYRSDEKRKRELDLVKESECPYKQLMFPGTQNPIEVIEGFPILYRTSDVDADIAKVSDFIIDSDICTDKRLPLVLPQGKFSAKFRYTKSSYWDENTIVPYRNPKALEERILPNNGEKYPYLSLSDFISDDIIRMEHNVNTEAYFDGNYIYKPQRTSTSHGFLLPLTDLFFRYFTADQLRDQVAGKEMIEIEECGTTSVKVTLRIPVRGGTRYIEFIKNYFDGNDSDMFDADAKAGKIVDKEFAFAFTSNIKFSDTAPAYYSCGVISKFRERGEFELSFYDGANKLKSDYYLRDKNTNESYKCESYIVTSNFDHVKVESNKHGIKVCGVIVPKFITSANTEVFSFAIDFGTSNTHIEYCKSGQPAKPLDITEKDKLISYLGDYNAFEDYIFDSDFIPEYVGANGASFKFPIRTILNTAKNTDWRTAVLPFSQVNIPFTYGHRHEYAYNEMRGNLKWAKDNIDQVKAYIESLFIIIRNKVILNNGDLSKTKIVWFYPVSMTPDRFGKFQKVWNDAYKKFFNGLEEPITMTESIAPYHFYAQVNRAANIVSIDVGGGTTDVVFADRNVINYITSFRFAANSIFGDAYSSVIAADKNGIIKQFEPSILEILKTNNLSELVDVYDKLNERNISSDVASFFFTLKDDKQVKDKGLADKLDFQDMLSQDDIQKNIFLVFYTAIIYHIAFIMKAKKLGMPRYLAFSGNGSRIISVLANKTVLESYTKLVFTRIFETEYNADGLTIVLNRDNPKEVTCKGGLIHTEDQSYMSIEDKKIVLKGNDHKSFVGTNDTYASLTSNVYEQVADQVIKFFAFLFGLHSSFDFTKNFGIKPKMFEIARDVCARDIRTYVENGKISKISELETQNTKIEESLFFYPLVNVLNVLAKANYDASKN